MGEVPTQEAYATLISRAFLTSYMNDRIRLSNGDEEIAFKTNLLQIAYITFVSTISGSVIFYSGYKRWLKPIMTKGPRMVILMSGNCISLLLGFAIG